MWLAVRCLPIKVQVVLVTLFVSGMLLSVSGVREGHLQAAETKDGRYFAFNTTPNERGQIEVSWINTWTSWRMTSAACSRSQACSLSGPHAASSLPASYAVQSLHGTAVALIQSLPAGPTTSEWGTKSTREVLLPTRGEDITLPERALANGCSLQVAPLTHRSQARVWRTPPLR